MTARRSGLALFLEFVLFLPVQVFVEAFLQAIGDDKVKEYFIEIDINEPPALKLGASSLLLVVSQNQDESDVVCKLSGRRRC